MYTIMYMHMNKFILLYFIWYGKIRIYMQMLYQYWEGSIK